MSKKIIIFSITILLIIAGVIFWITVSRKSAGDQLTELTKNLPQAIKVFKKNNSYTVVNEKDGYQIRMPESWKGFSQVGYFEEKTNLEPKKLLMLAEIGGNLVALAQYQLKDKNTFLNSFVEQLLQKSQELDWQKEERKIGKLATIRTTSKNQYLEGLVSYFFKKDLKIYELSGSSEKLLQELIKNGKW